MSIIADAEPRLVLTTADLREPLLQMNAQLSAANAPQLLCVDLLDPAVAEAWDEPQCVPSTSPSSSTPPVQPHCPRACRSAMATWSPTRC
ncbi:hypothetical protein P4234_15535 [Pseudomonas aeruginosa]|nr:hypothetical protein [Pseudomonas aeruginosa]